MHGHSTVLQTCSISQLPYCELCHCCHTHCCCVLICLRVASRRFLFFPCMGFVLYVCRCCFIMLIFMSFYMYLGGVVMISGYDVTTTLSSRACAFSLVLNKTSFSSSRTTELYVSFTWVLRVQYSFNKVLQVVKLSLSSPY